MSNVDDPVDAGSELHAQMEEAAVKAMAIVDGAAQFAVEAEKEQTENLLPAEIRYKRDIVDDKAILLKSTSRVISGFELRTF